VNRSSALPRPPAPGRLGLAAATAVMAVALVVSGCSSGDDAASAPDVTTAPVASADPIGQAPAAPEAQLTLASTTLTVGQTTTFGGTACPPGGRGQVWIVFDPAASPPSAPPLGGGIAGDDARWSFVTTVPDLMDGSAWTVATCTDAAGSLLFSYPRVALHLVAASG
jgi:hypothetical protein